MLRDWWYGIGVMTKADLYRLVDDLPESSVDAAALLLRRAADDPMLAVLDASPVDDEAYTDEQRATVEESLSDPSPSIPWDQVKRELTAE
jgi:hypothetical protein